MKIQNVTFVLFTSLLFYQVTHQSHEEECSVTIMGNMYIVDLGAMQQACNITTITRTGSPGMLNTILVIKSSYQLQINEDTGTTRSIRRNIADAAQVSIGAKEQEDARKAREVESKTRTIHFIQKRLYCGLLLLYVWWCNPSKMLFA